MVMGLYDYMLVLVFTSTGLLIVWTVYNVLFSRSDSLGTSITEYWKNKKYDNDNTSWTSSSS